MQLSYAAENLAVIPPEHFLARKATDLAAIKELLKKDPVGDRAEHSRKSGRRGHASADQPADDGRSFHRSGMEALVDLDDEGAEEGRLFSHSDEEDGADPIARGEGFARG